MATIYPYLPSTRLRPPATGGMGTEGMKRRLPVCGRMWVGVTVALGIVAAHWAPSTVRAQGATLAAQEPTALVSAREVYERTFVSEMGVLQAKYRGALEQYQRNFIRSGKLESAMEAKDEIRRVKYWRTVPIKGRSRELKDPDLNALLQNYETAVRNAVDPIAIRYQGELERLKASFMNSGDLEGSVKIDEELTRVKSGGEWPVRAALKATFVKFSKEEFHAWLQENTFLFSGSVAGDTRLTFSENTMNYDAANALAPVTYTYNLTSNRSLAIVERSFEIKFSNDLSSGEFTSDRGTYDIRINPPSSADPGEDSQP